MNAPSTSVLLSISVPSTPADVCCFLCSQTSHEKGPVPFGPFTTFMRPVSWLRHPTVVPELCCSLGERAGRWAVLVALLAALPVWPRSPVSSGVGPGSSRGLSSSRTLLCVAGDKATQTSTSSPVKRARTALFSSLKVARGTWRRCNASPMTFATTR